AKREPNLKTYGVSDLIKKFYLITILVVIFDQVTKYLAANITDPISIIPDVLQLRYVINTGAAFGLFQGAKVILGFLSVFIVAGILYFIVYQKDVREKYWLPLSFMAGGALGNAIDRLFYVGVIDFIDIRFWPVFNIADMFITLAVVLIFIIDFRTNRKEKKKV
ncbi:MAG: signal peptidase II, partial [Candidatus Woesearchaeota archaeon]